MPARDGSGPGGQGPETGRGLGDCSRSIMRRAGRQDQAGERWFGRLFRRRQSRNFPRKMGRRFDREGH